jgi:hypothetical protein
VLLNGRVIENRADMEHPMGVKMDLICLSNWKADVQVTALRQQPHKVR